jgi:hypothetical protein
VVQDRSEALAIPHEWFGIKTALIIVTAVRKRRVLFAPPLFVVPSDGLAGSSLAISIAKNILRSESQFRGYRTHGEALPVGSTGMLTMRESLAEPSRGGSGATPVSSSGSRSVGAFERAVYGLGGR